MNTISAIKRRISLFLVVSILFSSCASTTVIQSIPSGAKVYIDEEPVGKTPYYHTDTKIVGSTMMITIKKDGYETLNTAITRNEEVDVGAIVGGVFTLVPFLWVMKYKPTHTYELIPTTDSIPSKTIVIDKAHNSTKSKAERLRELKKLLDEKILTQEEFEKEKQKILEEKE